MEKKSFIDFTVEDIQEEMLFLLKKFHSLCIDHGIKYSVHAGTMIGMVREHGFIPWDDDADISFTRENFDKFSALVKNKGIDHLLQGNRDEHFYFSVMDNAFPQLWMVRRNRPAVWLDFFIYDYITENKVFQKVKFAEIAFSLGFLKNKKSMELTKRRGLYSGCKYWIIYLTYIFGKLFPVKVKQEIAEKQRKGFPGKRKLIHRANDRFVGVVFTYPKSVMSDYVLMDFEDTQLMITKDYESILVPSYGNYMTPVVDATAESDVHSYGRRKIPFKVPPINLDESELEKLRGLELKCLAEFDRICRKHNIQYFLGGGTLLGAVRHKGFIPWDDDIDVMMLPDEYNKFLKIIDRELGEDFVYQSKTNDSEYHSIFDKIRLKDTVFDTYFSRRFDLKSHGIFIDIFVHDYISDNRMIQKIHIFRTIFERSLVHHKWDDSPMQFYGKFKLICKFASIYKDLMPMSKLEKREMKTVTRYNSKKTGFLYDGRGEHTRHGAFAEYILTDGSMDVPFCGISVSIPKHYDEYLKFSYGNDYMNLPPIEKRVPGHDLAYLNFGKYENEY